MIKSKIVLIILLGVSSISSITAKDDPYFIEIDSINSYFSLIERSHDDSQKEIINDKLISYFSKFLENPSSLKANMDSLKYVSVLRSDDKLLNVYTWNLYFSNGAFKYFGFLQYNTKDKINVYFLNDKKYNPDDDDDGIVRRYASNMEWYGAIYYELITKKSKSSTYYTLIGWDGADFMINRKVIEVLKFDRYGLPVFGGKVFKLDKSTAGRLIFEYADRATMLLRYNSKSDIIVLDHLAPSEEKYRGMYQYYGPDYSYDALIFKNGRWVHEPNIDAEIAINFKKNNKINNMKKRGFSQDF